MAIFYSATKKTRCGKEKKEEENRLDEENVTFS
jgi:hypothetical protein